MPSHVEPTGFDEKAMEPIQQLLIFLVTLVSFSVIAPPLIFANDADVRKATLSTEQIRQGLIRSNNHIRAWYIEYESEPSSDGSYLHRRIAAKYPDLFFHWSAHASADCSWQDDPLQQRLILKGSTGINEFPFSRSYVSYSWDESNVLPGTAPEELIFMAPGWWCFEKRRAGQVVEGMPDVICDVASSSAYIVRPYQESIQGRYCHVLEWPGRDRLWIDCNRDFILLAREIIDPNSPGIVHRIELSGHRQINPGIWAPAEIRNTFLSTASALGAPPLIEGIFKVLDVKFNDDVPDELFEFKPRAGSIRVSVSDDGQFEQTVPGGTDYMDDLVSWIQRHAQGVADEARPTDRSREELIEYSLSGLCAAIIALVSISKWSRRRLNSMKGRAVP